MLKAAGLYCTESRILIMRVLSEAGKPLSREKTAKKSGKSHFDKVTIYRTLESLMKARRVLIKHTAGMEKKITLGSRHSTILKI